jgi:hypothetical protein
MKSAIVERSIHTLRAMRAKFIIVLPDGETIVEGDLKLEEPKLGRRRRNPDIPRGALTSYYMPYLQNMKPGDLVEIPYGNFPPAVLAGSISSRVCQMWGNKTTTTAQNSEKKVVEVLRFA